MSASRRILLLGASGFVGRAIADALHADPRCALVAARHRSALRGDIASRALDATDGAALRQALASFDVVVNAVLGTPATLVNSTQALIDAASVNGCRIVHLSTMAVYGSQLGRVSEDAPMRADVGDYAAAKAEAERRLQAHPQRVVLRPGIVYGAEGPQWSQRIAKWLRARRIGDLGVAGDGICNLVHVRDVAQAVVLACFNDAVDGRSFNLSLPQPPTWNEYFIAFGCALGATPVACLNPLQLKLEQRLGLPLEAAARIAGKLGIKGLPQGITPALWRLWAQRIQLDVTAAEQALGVRWLPLDEGLRETAAALRDR